MQFPLTVTVTQDDIDNGAKNNNMDCPIARAFYREAGMCMVSVMTVKFTYNGKDVEAELPDVAVKFISHFDSALPVQPFSFTIEESAVKNLYDMRYHYKNFTSLTMEYKIPHIDYMTWYEKLVKAPVITIDSETVYAGEVKKATKKELVLA